MQSVNVNGVDLEYEVRGAGEPVLLIDMLIADCFVPLLPEPALADPAARMRRFGIDLTKAASIDVATTFATALAVS